MFHVSKEFLGFSKFYLAGSGIERAANCISPQLGQGMMSKAELFNRRFGGNVIILGRRNLATMIILET